MIPATAEPKIPENGLEPEFWPEFLRNFEPSLKAEAMALLALLPQPQLLLLLVHLLLPLLLRVHLLLLLLQVHQGMIHSFLMLVWWKWNTRTCKKNARIGNWRQLGQLNSCEIDWWETKVCLSFVINRKLNSQTLSHFVFKYYRHRLYPTRQSTTDPLEEKSGKSVPEGGTCERWSI